MLGLLDRRTAQFTVDEALRGVTSTFLHNLIPNDLSPNVSKLKREGKQIFDEKDARGVKKGGR